MTSEQLQHARAERWRQASNPILTSDDAKAWVEGIGLCLFLPRRAHVNAPAPSLVEAVMGAPSEAPGREAIENATSLLRRLTDDVVPLSLIGSANVSDQPDFLVTRAAVPYVFSLIGGRNWKSSPGAKASPLMTDIWTLLNAKGALRASEIQDELGRELTEAAVLRGLVELWGGLRVIPAYDGATTRWELTQARFAAELTASQAIAQSTALSVLVALYMDSAVAASVDQIEAFLSPLTARSRVREVVNGLMATRQVALVSIGAHPVLHVAGSLPEFVEEPAAQAETRRDAVVREEEPKRRTFDRERKPFDRRERGHIERGDRKPFKRAERFAGDRGGERPADDRNRRAFGAKRDEGEKPRGERRFGSADDRGKFRKEKPFAGKKHFGTRRGDDRSSEREPRGERQPPFRERGTKFEGGKPRRFDAERREGSRFEDRKWEPKGGFKPKFERGEGREFPKKQGSGFRSEKTRGFSGGGKTRFQPGDRKNFEQRGNASGRPEKPFGRSGKPFRSAERPYSKSGKPFGKAEGSFAKRGKPYGKPPARSFGKGNPGKPKQGGFKPPFRKRKQRGSEDAE